MQRYRGIYRFGHGGDDYVTVFEGGEEYDLSVIPTPHGAFEGDEVEIFTQGELTASSYFVDPIPQALTLTSIVIGACVTAMSLALVIKLEEQYGTIDTREIRRLRG